MGPGVGKSRIWGVPGASWGRPGASWGRLGASWGRLGGVLGPPGASWGQDDQPDSKRLSPEGSGLADYQAKIDQKLI